MAICYKCRRLKEACRCPKPQRRNATMRKWYKTARWARLRMYVGQRDMWLCQACKRNGIEEPGNEIDHIKRAADHEDLFWNPNNLETLCKPCHSRKTKEEGIIRGDWL